MASETMEVGVIVERRRLDNPWVDHAWSPCAVLAGAPDAEPWTLVESTPDRARYYAGSCQLAFFSSETERYRDNLRSGRPSLWVSLRVTDRAPGVALQSVTADSAEGEALTEAGTDIIDAVPMAPAIQARLAAFVQTHHVERPFVKRKRDRADPEAMASRPRTAPRRED